MRLGVKAFVVLGAAAAASLLTGGACGGGRQLTGAGGGAGIVSSGSAGSQVMTGSGGSGTAAAGGTGPTQCISVARPAPPLPPDVLIVLDTSASMNDGFDAACSNGCGASSKWATAVAAIDSVVDSTPSVANWGLKLMNDGAGVCDAGGVAVSAGPGTGAQIQAALASRSIPPGLARPGNRPTRAAIDVAAANRLAATDLGSQFMLLVTDGAPDCKGGASDPLASDVDAAIQAITNAGTAGIPTCILGLGTAGGPADATLAQMALVSFCPISPGSYIPIASGADLVSALNAMAAQAGACLFAIPPPPTNDGTTTRGLITVYVNGTGIPQNAPDGWTYANASQTVLQLYGAACTASRSQSVSVVFNCLAV